MTPSLTTLPETTQTNALAALTKNGRHSISDLDRALKRYSWCMFLFESPSAWINYALTRGLADEKAGKEA